MISLLSRFAFSPDLAVTCRYLQLVLLLRCKSVLLAIHSTSTSTTNFLEASYELTLLEKDCAHLHASICITDVCRPCAELGNQPRRHQTILALPEVAQTLRRCQSAETSTLAMYARQLRIVAAMIAPTRPCKFELHRLGCRRKTMYSNVLRDGTRVAIQEAQKIKVLANGRRTNRGWAFSSAPRCQLGGGCAEDRNHLSPHYAQSWQPAE